MKCNLKNRPKPPKFHNWRKIHRFLYEYHEWIEGLEKQEREKNRITAVKIQELGDAKQIPLEQLGFLRGYLQRGKEILGEEEK